jgi:hypothetical protein
LGEFIVWNLVEHFLLFGWFGGLNFEIAIRRGREKHYVMSHLFSHMPWRNGYCQMKVMYCVKDEMPHKMQKNEGSFPQIVSNSLPKNHHCMLLA